MRALAAVLIKLAVAVLAYYQGRADFREMVLLEVENAGLKRLIEAQRWASSPDADTGLGVRDPTQHLAAGATPAVPDVRSEAD